jgi:hypothetical protein
MVNIYEKYFVMTQRKTIATSALSPKKDWSIWNFIRISYKVQFYLITR